MNVKEQIKKYIAGLPELKRGEMQRLHELILQALPSCKLWFEDGKNSKDKTVSDPTIGYGLHVIKYANGKTKEFFKIGISANIVGISVYILGIKDKAYIAQTFGKKLGKAKVTGYCILFKTLKDINIDILEAAIRYGGRIHSDSRIAEKSRMRIPCKPATIAGIFSLTNMLLSLLFLSADL